MIPPNFPITARSIDPASFAGCMVTVWLIRGMGAAVYVVALLYRRLKGAERPARVRPSETMKRFKRIGSCPRVDNSTEYGQSRCFHALKRLFAARNGQIAAVAWAIDFLCDGSSMGCRERKFVCADAVATSARIRVAVVIAKIRYPVSLQRWLALKVCCGVRLRPVGHLIGPICSRGHVRNVTGQSIIGAKISC
jgi:hypothetical protein